MSSEWPSKNVARGGVFQHAKVNYSPETTRFLQTLIRESKMTTMQRNRINYSLRTGEPLPALSGSEKRGAGGREPQVLIRPGSSKRRSYETIVRSGVYDREQFAPAMPRVDREKAKEELQERMAFGRRKGAQTLARKEPAVVERKAEANRFDEIKQEIREREEWLSEMEALGEGDKYRLVINQQIQDRVREMRRLKLADE